MSIEDLTQEEWDERREQLDKYFDGVEKRYIARLGVAMGFSREWVGLTDEEIKKVFEADWGRPNCPEWVVEFSKKIEAKLKEKNGG